MNSKRQTIWLVSMLSLMVVLSAYYLFTDSPNQMKIASNGEQQSGSDLLNAEKIGAQQGIKAQEVNGQDAVGTKGDQAAADSTKQQSASGTDKQQASAADSTQAGDSGKTDAQVLDSIKTQATSGTDYFINLQMKRNDEMSKKYDDLMKIINNNSLDSGTIGKAYSDMRKLEDTQAKVTNLEEELLKDYPNAVVNQADNNEWQVVVQSDKLEKSQAVSIMDQVTKELNVEPNQVVIKYMK